MVIFIHKKLAGCRQQEGSLMAVPQKETYTVKDIYDLPDT